MASKFTPFTTPFIAFAHSALMRNRFGPIAKGLQRSTRITNIDGNLPPLVYPGSPLYNIMKCQNGRKLDQGTWDDVVCSMAFREALGTPFEHYDVKTFNSWFVSPDLIMDYLKKCGATMQLLDEMDKIDRDAKD